MQRALEALDLEYEADEPMEIMAKVYGPSFFRRVVIARAVLRGFDILLVRVGFCCTQVVTSAFDGSGLVWCSLKIHSKDWTLSPPWKLCNISESLR